MKVKIFFIILIILIGEKVEAQATYNKDIVSTWVSEEDADWEIVFARNHKYFQYYADSLVERGTFVISNTTPQCGLAVEVAKHTSYLSLTSDGSEDKICYEINGLTSKFLSLRVIDQGGAIVFHRKTKRVLRPRAIVSGADKKK